MKKSAGKALVLIVGVVFVAMFITGCEEQAVSDTKKAKLIAEENRQLKDQLQQRSKEIERQKDMLAECQEQKKVLQGQTQEKMETMMGVLLETMGKESARMQQENQELKAEIEKLKQ